jgi:hypothetical protein
MPGVVETTNTFATNDVITSTAMNNIIDQTLFTSDAIAAGNTTLALVSGKMKVGTITSNEMGTNAVTANAIAADAVTTAKILDANVTTAKILDANVTTAKILDANVTTAKIADAAITAPKLDGAQTGTAPIYGMRAYVVFDASRNAAGATDSLNTTRFLISSGNVASVTKTASGAFTVAFTTALPNANYAYFGTSRVQGGSDILVFRADGGTKTTTAFQFVTMSRGGSATNPEDCSLVFIG